MKPAEGAGCNTAPVAVEPTVRVIVVLAAHRSHSIASTDSSAKINHGKQLGQDHGKNHGQQHRRHNGRHNEKHHKRHPICYPIRRNSAAVMNEPSKTHSTKSLFAFALVKNSKFSNSFIPLKPEYEYANNTLFSKLSYVLISNQTNYNYLNLATIYAVSVFFILYFYILFWLIIIIYYHGLE